MPKIFLMYFPDLNYRNSGLSRMESLMFVSCKRRNPYVAVDAVIFDETFRKIVLIRRKNEPFKDYFALPGGFVEIGETTETACKREVKEEVGIDVDIIDLIGVFSDPNRDPRGHVISIAYICKALSINLHSGSDAKMAVWIDLDKIKEQKIKLAFDHETIIKKALMKLKII